MTPTEAAAVLSEVEGIALPVLAALEPGPAATLVKLALDALVAALKAIDKEPEPDFASKLQAAVDRDVAAKTAEWAAAERPGPGGMGDGDKPAG